MKSNILKYVWCKFRLAMRQFGQFICALKFREWIKTMLCVFFLLHFILIHCILVMAKSGRKTLPKTILFLKSQLMRACACTRLMPEFEDPNVYFCRMRIALPLNKIKFQYKHLKRDNSLETSCSQHFIRVHASDLFFFSLRFLRISFLFALFFSHLSLAMRLFYCHFKFTRRPGGHMDFGFLIEFYVNF